MDVKPNNSLGTVPNTTLINALRRVLRPLIKLLIANQVTYPFLSGLLKSLYVEVSEKEFQVPGKKQTDSRINLLTGVHRKDVKRLRREIQGPSPVPANISIGAQLVARWLADPRFQDRSGKPLLLPLRGKQAGGGATFDDLVEEVARQDLRPRVVLDELLRLGIVTLEEDMSGKVVRLSTGAFTPVEGIEEKLFFFGKNIQDHISAGVHNLSGNQPAFFDRSVYYDQLSRNSIDTLTGLCNRIGMEALVIVNKKALELQNQDEGNPRTYYRMNFGIFNFTADYGRRQREGGDSTGKEDD